MVSGALPANGHANVSTGASPWVRVVALANHARAGERGGAEVVGEAPDTPGL
jgi:hypothetical protein